MLQRVCAEMQSSEGIYLDSISTLLCSFLAPLIEQRLCDSLHMSEAAKQAWRSCHTAAQPIVHLHQDLHRELQAIEVVKPTSIGALVCSIADVFIRYSSFLKLYNVFIGAYLPCMEQVAPMSQGGGASSSAPNRAFTKWQEERKGTKQQNLQSLLIIPVQRVPRYELLLNKIAEEFAKDSAFDPSANERLTRAREAINSSSKSLNESKRDSEGQARLMTLHTSIRGLQAGYIILESHRRYVSEATVVQVFPRPSAARKKLQFWLCNDVLVLVSAAPNWKVKGWIELADVTRVNAPQEGESNLFGSMVDGVYVEYPNKCLSISSVESSATPIAPLAIW